MSEAMRALSDAEKLLKDRRNALGASYEITASDVEQLYTKLKSAGSPPLIEEARRFLPVSYRPRRDLVGIPCAVIIETRAHKDLSFIIDQVHRKLGLHIQLFHGPENGTVLETPVVKGLLASGWLEAIELGSSALTGSIYNGLLLSREFWDLLRGRGKILFFQTDAILCCRSRFSLDDFLSFDYIGANWDRRRPVGLIIDGGCGGFSLRDWHKSVLCLNRFDPARWKGGEDGYFAFHIQLVDGKVAYEEDCACFCTQTSFTERSLAVHQPSQLSLWEKLRLIMYCPQSWRVISKRLNRTS